MDKKKIAVVGILASAVLAGVGLILTRSKKQNVPEIETTNDEVVEEVDDNE